MSAEAAFLDTISGRRRGLGPAAVRAVLSCGEPFYAAATKTRNALYDRGFLKTAAVSVPVISVGNVTTGGTGKTPFVAAVVQELLRLHRSPGIASRGFRSLDGIENDEKRVLDLLCPGVPHAQNRIRVEAARSLLGMGVNAIVLDDAFQHRQLRRDLDLVVIDATNPWGYRRQLPRGLLRESPRGLKRAGLVVVTRADLISRGDREALVAEIGQFTSAPLVVSRFVAHGLRGRNGSSPSLSDWQGRRVMGFCGIGNPAAFQATLDRIGLALPAASVTAFPDHHHYSPDDLGRLFTACRAMQADALVCTLKDLVKLPEAPSEIPILAVEIQPDILDGLDAWRGAIAAVVERGNRGSRRRTAEGERLLSLFGVRQRPQVLREVCFELGQLHPRSGRDRHPGRLQLARCAAMLLGNQEQAEQPRMDEVQDFREVGGLSEIQFDGEPRRPIGEQLSGKLRLAINRILFDRGAGFGVTLHTAGRFQFFRVRSCVWRSVPGCRRGGDSGR